jgi:hypothetical protein
MYCFRSLKERPRLAVIFESGGKGKLSIDETG